MRLQQGSVLHAQRRRKYGHPEGQESGISYGHVGPYWSPRPKAFVRDHLEELATGLGTLVRFEIK